VIQGGAAKGTGQELFESFNQDFKLKLYETVSIHTQNKSSKNANARKLTL
jgi:hypothetical protein